MKPNEVLVVRADSFKGKKDPTKTYYTMDCIVPTQNGNRAKQLFINEQTYAKYMKPGVYETVVNITGEILDINLVKEVNLP